MLDHGLTRVFFVLVFFKSLKVIFSKQNNYTNTYIYVMHVLIKKAKNENYFGPYDYFYG